MMLTSAATGTPIAAIAVAAFIPVPIEKAVAKTVPELASILKHHRKYQHLELLIEVQHR
jgi:hypothetical protein